MTRSASDATAERVLRRIRREMLGVNEEGLRQLDVIYERAAAGIHEELRGVTSRATIERIARERLNDALIEALPVISAGIDAGALAGARTPAAQFAAIFPRATAPRVATEIEAQQAAARVLRGRIQARDVPLAARLDRNHRELARNMAREIQTSMRAGENAFQTMERVLELNSPTGRASIPQYVQRLGDAARAAAEFQDDGLEREIRKVRRYVDGLGSSDRGNTSIRAASEQLITDLRRAVKSASEADVDRIVDRWAQDKAQYQAKVIARTEAIAAHREAYETSMKKKPWTKGFKWALSPGHKLPDVCDLLANQNLHGLGPGGYPPDALPNTPHPSCTCSQTAIIDELHFERELAELEGTVPPPESWDVGGEQSAAEWLAQQPEQLQAQVLGPTRLAVFRTQPNRVIEPNGSIRLVRDVLPDPARAAAE